MRYCPQNVSRIRCFKAHVSTGEKYNVLRINKRIEVFFFS
jgi:hypothetical protein